MLASLGRFAALRLPWTARGLCDLARPRLAPMCRVITMQKETPQLPTPPSHPTPPPLPPNDPVEPRDPAKIPVEEAVGGTDEEVGDRSGPAAGYDQEPVQEKDTGGVV